MQTLRAKIRSFNSLSLDFTFDTDFMFFLFIFTKFFCCFKKPLFIDFISEFLSILKLFEFISIKFFLSANKSLHLMPNPFAIITSKKYFLKF